MKTRRFVFWLVRLVMRLIARIEVTGIENVPASGGVIFAGNHIGFIDIGLFYYLFERTDMFIPVAEKWEKKGWIRWLGRRLNFIFIDRFNPDLKAMRQMMALMQSGHALVISPEGTRSRTGALIEGKQGVAFLAARSGFPVIPVAITGTEDKVLLANLRRFKRTKVTVTGGVPFVLPTLPKGEREQTLQRYTDEVMCQIAALLPERYWGVYAGHDRLKELLG